jgi:hypothetical protein
MFDYVWQYHPGGNVDHIEQDHDISIDLWERIFEHAYSIGAPATPEKDDPTAFIYQVRYKRVRYRLVFRPKGRKIKPLTIIIYPISGMLE